MRELQRCLAEVCAHPAKSAPRLELAGLLARTGQHPRAALIKAQLERGRLPAHDPRQALYAELEQRLLAEHGAAWRAAELPHLPGLRWGGFECGFVGALEVDDPDSFLAHVGPIFAHVPVQRLRLHNLDSKTLKAILRLPELRGVEELDLADNILGNVGAQALAQSRYLTALKQLNLRNTVLGSVGLAAFANASWHAYLAHINLEQNQLADLGAEILASTFPWTKLRRLDLGDNDVTPLGINALAENICLRQLQQLSIQGGRIGDAGLKVLAEQMHELECLQVGANEISDAGLLPLTAAGVWPRLTQLDLGRNRLTSEGVRRLLDAPLSQHLAHLGLAALDLRGLDWPCAGRDAAPPLTSLDLSGTQLQPATLCALAASPNLSRLTSLTLTANPLGMEGAQVLAGSPYLNRLRKLDLSLCQLTDDGLRALVARPLCTALQELHLSENQLGPAGAAALAGAANFASLQALRLDRNPLGDAGIAALAAAPHWRRLRVLDVTRTDCTDVGADALLQASHFQEVCAGENPISYDKMRALRQRFHGPS